MSDRTCETCIHVSVCGYRRDYLNAGSTDTRLLCGKGLPEWRGDLTLLLDAKDAERRNENDRLRRELDAALDAALPEHPGDGSCEYCSFAPGSWVFLCDEHNPMVTDAQHAELACGGDPLGRCDEKPRKARAAKMATRKPASGAECSACGGSGTVGKGFSDLGVPCSVCRGTGKPASGEFDHLAVSPDWEERKVESASAESAPVCDVYGRSGERLACYDDPDGEDTGVMPARMEPCPACTPSAAADTGQADSDKPEPQHTCGECAEWPGGGGGDCSFMSGCWEPTTPACEMFKPRSEGESGGEGLTCISCKYGPSPGQWRGYCEAKRGIFEGDHPACVLHQLRGSTDTTDRECYNGDDPDEPICENDEIPSAEECRLDMAEELIRQRDDLDALRRDLEEHCATATDLEELTERVERLAEAVNAYGDADRDYTKRLDRLETSLREIAGIVADRFDRAADGTGPGWGCSGVQALCRIAARTDGGSSEDV